MFNIENKNNKLFLCYEHVIADSYNCACFLKMNRNDFEKMIAKKFNVKIKIFDFNRTTYYFNNRNDARKTVQWLNGLLMVNKLMG